MGGKGIFGGPPFYFERNLSLKKYSCVTKHVHKFTADRDAHETAHLLCGYL